MNKTFTNIEAYNAFQVLRDCRETGKLGYAIAKNMRKLQEELKEYSVTIEELTKRYGKDIGNGQYSISDMGAYMAERAQYDSIDCDVDIMQVDEDTFCSGTLTNDQMYMLDWMVT